MTQAVNYSVPLVGPSTPTNFAQRIDDNFDAIISGHSGSARPAYAVAGMIWEDTSVANETRLWFYDGSQDILVAVVDTANDRVELAPQPLVDVASAATTDIGAVKSRNIRVTGTTAITSFGTIRAGTTRTVYFAAALTVTYNATSLITPTGASLAVAAGDSIDLVSLGSGNWRVLRHTSTVVSTPITKFFSSSEQTITSGGQLTIAHGLGATPKFVIPTLICKTADNGYAVGDVVQVNQMTNAANPNSLGQSIVADATNLVVRFAGTTNVYELLNKSTGIVFATTISSWRLVVRAFA